MISGGLSGAKIEICDKNLDKYNLHISLISGAVAAIAFALSGGIFIAAFAGGLAALLATIFLVDGESWQDVANNTVAGFAGGFAGAAFASLLIFAMMPAFAAAIVSGLVSGSMDALILMGNPIFENDDNCDD